MGFYFCDWERQRTLAVNAVGKFWGKNTLCERICTRFAGWKRERGSRGWPCSISRRLPTGWGDKCVNNLLVARFLNVKTFWMFTAGASKSFSGSNVAVSPPECRREGPATAFGFPWETGASEMSPAQPPCSPPSPRDFFHFPPLKTEVNIKKNYCAIWLKSNTRGERVSAWARLILPRRRIQMVSLKPYHKRLIFLPWRLAD